MSLQAILDAIPYVAHHRARVLEAEAGTVRVCVPMTPQVQNYVGTMHAGALFTAAETAAGAAAFAVVPGGKAVGLLRQATVHYTRRAQGDVTATASIENDSATAARERFRENGKADIPIAVVLTDSDENTVFRGTFDYALRPSRA